MTVLQERRQRRNGRLNWLPMLSSFKNPVLQARQWTSTYWQSILLNHRRSSVTRGRCNYQHLSKISLLQLHHLKNTVSSSDLRKRRTSLEAPTVYFKDMKAWTQNLPKINKKTVYLKLWQKTVLNLTRMACIRHKTSRYNVKRLKNLWAVKVTKWCSLKNFRVKESTTLR